MPTVKKEMVVPYAVPQMFELVNKIEDYPDFVPWCKSATILSRTSEEIHASLDFSRGGMHKSFTTLNRLQENKMIEIRLLDGPFDHLEGFWLFEEMPSGCKVVLDLTFEFSNKMMALMFGSLFHTVANTLVDVFKQRAEQIYGQ